MKPSPTTSPDKLVETLLNDSSSAATPEKRLESYDDEERDAAASFEGFLAETLEDAGCRIQTFADAGVMTRNSGLVVRHGDKKFQVTIVEDRRGY